MKKRTKIIIAVLVFLALLSLAIWMFFGKDKAKTHPSMLDWSDLKRAEFKKFSFAANYNWKLKQANEGEWPQIFAQMAEWELPLEAAIRKHNEWEWDNARMIEGYINNEHWLNNWSAFRMQNGLDENGF